MRKQSRLMNQCNRPLLHLLLYVIPLALHFRPVYSCLFQIVPIIKKFDGPGDYGEPFESKRRKTLDCTCGTIPTTTTSNSSAKFRFPWQVLISHSSTVPSSPGTAKVCRGTIINDRIILTTASCVLKLSIAEVMDNPAKAVLFPDTCYAQPEELQVRLSSSGGVLGSTPLEVKHIYRNPLFLFQRIIHDKVDYDIALLTLKSPLAFTSEMVPICLPNSAKGGDLAGLESIFTRWRMNNSTQDIEEETPPFISFFYPKMRCRLNAGHDWISNRFLCTLAPDLVAVESIEVGGAEMVKNGEQYVQYGVHSWRAYHPLIYSRKPLSLASDVKGFLGKIENYSEEMGANWCKNDLSGGGIPKKGDQYNGVLVNDPVGLEQLSWTGIKSESRKIRKNCKCGLVNSLASTYKARGRIVNGKDATPYEYGWQVQLNLKYGKDEDQLCGGSVLNDLVIVTAAHCVYKTVEIANGKYTISGLIRPENVRVYLHRYTGSQLRDDNSRVARVESVIAHPGFRVDGVVKNDIALIVLRKRICFKCLRGKVSPICFPNTGENLNLDGRTDARVIGWGRMDVLDSKSKAAKLQEVDVSIISREECIKVTETLSNAFHTNQVKRDENKLCAGNFKGPSEYRDPAQGDSGSPLFLPITPGTDTMIHVGVASMITMGEEALRKNDKTTVTFYTRTQSYLEFVDYYSLIVDANWCER